MFQFPACPPVRLCIHLTVTDSSSAGFPHSDILGSMPACGSPGLFAACHVLLRRMVPGHPPCALCSLIFSSLDPETNCLLTSRSLSEAPATGLKSIVISSLCGCQGAGRVSTGETRVGRSGLEPPTSRLSGECSNQLS